MVMATMDGTIVATALPSIATDLGGRDSITWVVTAYLLAGIATAPLYGKIGDVYGRKSVYLFAITLFTVGVDAVRPGADAAAARRGPGTAGDRVGRARPDGDGGPRRPGAHRASSGAGSGTRGRSSRSPASRGRSPAASSSTTSAGGGRSSSTSRSRSSPSSSSCRYLKVPYRRVEHSIDFLGSALLTAALALGVLLLTEGGHEIGWVSPESAALLAAVGAAGVPVRPAGTAAPRSRSSRCAC